jgi:hypothetical protein
MNDALRSLEMRAAATPRAVDPALGAECLARQAAVSRGLSHATLY